MAIELRVRTLIEMVLRKNIITALPIANKVIWVSPNYITSVMDCASERGWSSIWTIFALAEAIGKPVKSVYPPLNGVQDFCFRFLNITAIPHNFKDEDDLITVMWTRSSLHDPSKMFTPNHFAPLIKDIIVPTEAIPPSLDSFEEFPLLQATSVLNNSSNSSKKSPVEVNSVMPQKKHESEPTICIDTSTDVEMSDSLPNSNALTNGQNLTATQVFSSAMNTELSTVDSIPRGYKDNVFFVFNNSHNLQQNSKHNRFADDCGSWNTHSGRTTKADFIIMSDNTLKWTVQKNDMYCFERQVKGKKTYIQYDPQPKHVVTIHRYYTSLKREKTYKKRVSWFENLPDSFSTLSHKAIIEYTGVCPRQGEPHGNSKNSSQEYVRTDPKIIDEVKDRIQQKQSCADIYKHFVI